MKAEEDPTPRADDGIEETNKNEVILQSVMTKEKLANTIQLEGTSFADVLKIAKL